MPNKKKITNRIHTTYEDQQSLAETHDMLIKALPGQSYVKEQLHKVSTTQVTGDALMKVSVGGKGGFAAGTAGDVREKKQDLQANVVRMEKKEVFVQRLKVLRNLGLERDYDDFVYQGDADASDSMQNAEFYNKTVKSINIELMRELYDETCGYRGAWKYVGLDGAEHRRYRIFIDNTLNFNDAKDKAPDIYRDGYMNWDSSSYNHHVVGPNFELYLECNPSARKDHAQYMMLQLSKIKDDTNEFLTDLSKVKERGKRVPTWEDAVLVAHQMQLEAEKKGKLKAMIKNQGINYDDWKTVYNWELKVNGKTKFK